MASVAFIAARDVQRKAQGEAVIQAAENKKKNKAIKSKCKRLEHTCI